MSPTKPLAVRGAILDGEMVGLRCVDGRIAALGAGVDSELGDETIDAAGMPLVAPLINGHTHAAMTLFRGYGGDLPLMRWLQEVVWPVEAKLEAEDVYWGVRLACAEMIRAGTTRFWDMYWHPDATARAVQDSGMRATIGGPLFDADGGTASMQETALENLAALADCGPRIGRALAPHSIYMVSEALLRWTAETASTHEAAVHIHLAETEQEVNDCLDRHGVRPAAYLDGLGLLGERTVLAHGVWLDEEELALVAARRCTLVTNPVANMKLAVGGVFPYPAARKAGAAIALGTDGPGSNDSLDLLSDLKIFALLQRHANGDPTVLPAAEAWAIATGARAPLLATDPAAEHHVGEQIHAKRDALRVGGPADFLLLRSDSALALGELEADLVYAASGSVVDTTVVAGQALMRNGEIEGEEEIVARARERAQRLGIG